MRSDLTLHTDKPFSWFSVFTHLRRPSFCAVFLFRAGAACYRKGRVGKLLSLILARINLMLHACEI
ncbi:MAG TPA: hypothetical protein VFR09_01090, partial [Alphaproteobacteria bacterium]|nr:hypothetical protein [Alphaproteobacteria bacterium]